jgi:hypothetical protein
MKTQTLILGALALAAAVFASPLQKESGQSCCGSTSDGSDAIQSIAAAMQGKLRLVVAHLWL